VHHVPLAVLIVSVSTYVPVGATDTPKRLGPTRQTCIWRILGSSEHLDEFVGFD